VRAAIALGTRHAVVCVGCCAGLMTALTGAGAIAPFWMGALGALMLAEKTLPAGAHVARTSGVALLGIAAVLLVIALD
jgi:predicted metal-binding membrane protein